MGIIFGFDYGWVWFRVVVGVSVEMGLGLGWGEVVLNFWLALGLVSLCWGVVWDYVRLGL